jgi:pentatricopeptide repeat protein
VFIDLQNNGVNLSVIMCNAMITAYGNGEQWQKAEQMFAELQNKGLKADLITYSAMITSVW